MSNPGERVRKACEAGDIATLRTLFSELEISPDHPSWNRALLPEHLHTLDTVRYMMWTVCDGGHIDALRFLCSYFNNCKPDLGCIGSAADNNNVQLLKEICRLDSNAANSQIGHHNILAWACGVNKSPEMVRVLLEAGADTNRPSAHIGFRDDWYVVTGGLPASTVERFFDAGYKMENGGPMGEAIKRRRVDIIEVLYRRGRELPNPILPSAQELMAAAASTENPELADLAKRLFPKDFPEPERKNTLATWLQKLR